MRNARYELLVFDWDGTLMDSQARIVRCLAGAAHSTGAPKLEEHRLRDVIGLGLHEAIRQLYPAAPEAFLHDFADAYRTEFLGTTHAPSRLFEGVTEVLNALAAEGYRLAVATGKSRRGLDRELGETGLADVFEATRCADETFSKPHPQMLVEILEDLGVSCGSALMIGDSEYDMMMARNAGTDALAVTYGVHALERLMGHAPRGHITSIRGLPSWLIGEGGSEIAAGAGRSGH
jgi:phosphoglycolate phosphatase